MQTFAETFLNKILTTAKKAFIYTGVFSLVINALMLTVPIYMLQIFDRIFSSHSIDSLIYLTIVALIALIILAALEKVRSIILITTSNWLDNKLSPEAIYRSTSEIMRGNLYPAQSLRDIAQLRQFLCGNSMLTIMDAPWVPIYLIVIFLMNWQLGVISTLGAIILFALAVLNERLTRIPLNMANKQAAKTQLQMGLTLKNAETIQAMGMISNVLNNWFNENEKTLQLQSLASAYSGTILAITKFLRFFLQIIMLAVGAYLVIHNQVSPGIMIAATIMLARALAPVEQSIAAWTQMTQAKDAYEHLQEYFQRQQPNTNNMVLPKPKGYLTVNDVTFIPYGSEKPTLLHINFAVKAGELLAILGPSAAGKTTLARLLVGAFKPHSGSVRLDSADVFSWNREDFSQYVGYLPQSIELFPGTIRENIARLGIASDQEVIAASQKAGVHEMILLLADGYDTELVNAGQQLSGGQRQRIALARALFRNPKLLVLDEPNASLDAAGEEALLKTLQAEKANGNTIIVISHRANILAIADKILFMKEGKINYFGAKDQVLAQLKPLHIEKVKE